MKVKKETNFIVSSKKLLISAMFSLVALSACTSVPINKTKVDSSYLNDGAIETTVTNAEVLSDNSEAKITQDNDKRFRFVPPLKLGTAGAVQADDLLSNFDDKNTIKLAADNLPLNEFLHQVFGEQLKLNYILSEEVEADKKLVTLNISDKISEQRLFTLTEELLTQRNYLIRFDANVFYIHAETKKRGASEVVYGYGKSINDIPQTSMNIVQMVPLTYGMQASLPNTMKLLLNIKAQPDIKRNALMLSGKRKDIVRAVEFINLMDTPTMSERHVGAYSVDFVATAELIAKLEELLSQEGIGLSKGKTTNKAISVVELARQGEVIFFSNELKLIERAVFWAKQIDKPVQTAEKQYFIFQPQFSRAVDMGESLEPLIGNFSGVSSSTSADSESTRRQGVIAASSKDMKMVVDERANSLIFYTSGTLYQQILPLIKRLDVLPKQVILEVVIAEVSLTDRFKTGIETVLTNQGAEKVGGFNLATGSTGLSYVLSGTQGSLTVNLLQTNTNVNILSRPSLLVRDGVSASISVGNDIPTVGEIVSDPTNGNRTSVVYRQTGVELRVTPTINAQGVIIMEIQQNISSQVEGDDSVAGSPIVSERKIGTEVIAESGQTIVLGGLISETTSKGDTSVPFFSSIPVVGHLFNSNNDSTDKNELVVLVTPKIVESHNEWQSIFNKFESILTNLEFVK